MTLYAGADAGQSATRVVLGDESGSVVGRATGGACYIGDGRSTPERVAFLEEIVAVALRDTEHEAGESPDDRPVRVLIAGVSGLDAPLAVAGEQCCDAVGLVHDTGAAHAGAFAGGQGVVVIAGSGSVALGIAGDHRPLVGGWGHMFGDEGSGFWIGRTVVGAAMRAVDGRTESGRATDAQVVEEELTPLILPALGVSDFRQVQHGFADGTIEPAKIAALAQPVIAYAKEHPQSVAAETVAQALVQLRDLARDAATQLDEPGGSTISYAGGLFADEWFAREFAALVGPPHRVVAPAHPPEVGALLLAYRTAGLTVEPHAAPA